MKAIRIHGKHDMRVDQVPTPQPGPGQVRLRMAYVGICGSDLHYFYDGAVGTSVIREPLIPGHEVSAVVDADPSGTFAAGTPVTVHPATLVLKVAGLEDKQNIWPKGAYLGSAGSWPHTQGGASEYLIVRNDQIRVLPAGMSLRVATLAEPLAVGLHAINVAGGVQAKRVLVSGSGPIGLLAAAAAKYLGAFSVTSSDVLDGPLARATQLGVDHVIRADRDDWPVEAFDVAVECSGVPAATNAAIAATRRAGVLAQVGMMSAGTHPVDMADILTKEIQLRGCFRFNNEIDQAIDLLHAHPEIEAVITHEFDADDYQQAWATAKDSQLSGKVLLSMWQPA